MVGTETIEGSMEKIFAPVENVISQVKEDFRLLTAIYLCKAGEDEEENCEHFIAGVSGKCCFADWNNTGKQCYNIKGF